jgi:pimeloyl-ACP methyl ester carboxylesterase
MIAFLAVLVALTASGAWLYTPDKPRAEIEQAYHATPGDYADAAGVRLHVRDTGPRNAPVIIMIHGFGSSLYTWDAWANMLSTTWRVVRFDLPGFGLTGPDPTNDYSDERSLAVLAALMDRLEIAHATLVGNSIGGKIAWKFAVENPARVDRLVLVSPDGFASPGFEYGKKPDVPAMLRALPYVLPRYLLRMSLLPAYGDAAALSDSVVDRYRDMMLVPGVRAAMVARMEQVTVEDPVPLLGRIEVPTLLVWGEKDGMIPFANAYDYLKAIPRSSLAALPGLGHVPQEEAPSASIAPVIRFLNRTAPHPASP